MKLHISLSYLALGIIVSFISWPGLSGPFLLDDVGNVSLLDNTSSLPGYTWYNFLADAPEGGLGRPLSFFTFWLQKDSWPSNPFSFKIFNFAIHIINGFIIYFLSRQLLINSSYKVSARALEISAFLLALIWIIHPLQNSTVFYVVQRMTELSAFFTLAGIAIVLQFSKSHTLTNKERLTIFLLVGTCYTLAVLSKENGYLLCLYLWSLTLVRGGEVKRLQLEIKLVYIALPIVLFIFYVYSIWPEISSVYQRRSFDMSERLVTQISVVGDYISQLIFPRLAGSGLFNDDYNINKSVFDSLKSVVSLFVIAVLLICAYLLKDKNPLFSFGVAWYFSGHIMESTFLPLELYFEHRNYLPSYGLFLSCAALLLPLLTVFRSAVLVFVLLYTSLIGWLTFENAKIWGNEELILRNWADENPASPRATVYIADYLARTGRLEDALATLENSNRLMPDHLSLRLSEIILLCRLQRPVERVVDEVLESIDSAKSDNAVIPAFEELTTWAIKGDCAGLTVQSVLSMLERLAMNSGYQYPSVRAQIEGTRAILYAEQGDLNLTMASIELAHDLYPQPVHLIQQALYLSSAGLFKEATLKLSEAEMMLDNQPWYKYRSDQQIIDLRRSINSVYKDQ
ncbi:MAG: hypothetical protein CME36_18665 [unclassified Hahellaceae]|nr:hypothetical protein [Hahellaceae bacterium]|tara:strand:+ start:94027 stop:95907 length:1881 start_codon:yes stop_codon:yes gene_type:complete